MFGIVNGVDTGEWNPATDRLIPAKFSVDDMSGKPKNKSALLGQLGLDPNLNCPLVGIVSRLTVQKGFELLFESMPRLLAEHDMRLAVLGSGAREYVEFFEWLVHQFPGRVGFSARSVPEGL